MSIPPGTTSIATAAAGRRARVWFRMTAILMLFFAAGHTFGFLSFRPATPEGQAVWSAMNSVHFTDSGHSFSYGGFYTGFGLSITVSQLFTAWVAWLLGSMARHPAPYARPLAWGLFATQAVGIALSFRYFGVPPAVLSVLATACIGIGAISIPRPADAAAAVAT